MLRTTFWLTAVALFLSATQPTIVVVTVVDAGAGFPLTNADVTELTTGQHRFSDEHGQVRFTWPNSGTLHLRVREIGYQPVERTLGRNDATDAKATFALKKVAYVISPVSDTSHCPTSHDSAALALSVSVLEQLK